MLKDSKAYGGIAVDDQGDLYLADYASDRVVKLRPRWSWPTPAAAQPTPRPTIAPVLPSPPAPPLVMTPTDR